MRFHSLKTLVFSLLAGATLMSSIASADDDKVNELAQFYGFSGIEIYKTDNRVFNLQSGDFNSDGLTDIMMIDNFQSCLRFLVQRSEADPARKNAQKVNDLASDWRMEERKIPMDKAIAGMAAGDFNGDGRLDIATIGNPDQLAVRYQPNAGEKEWTEKWTTRLPGLEPVSWMIAAGDLNSDKRDDIVVLGKDVTWLILQSEKGEMQTPVSLINTSQKLSMIQVADLNGDGRNDLCYLANEGSTRGLCARIQTNDGRLGPEISFALEQPRSVTLANIDQKPGHEVLTIASRKGRLTVSHLQSAEARQNSLPSRMLQYGIGPAGASRERSVVAGDFDGDTLADVLVNDPEQAQVLLYRQNGIDGLGVAEIFPGLLGITELASADLNKDGRLDAVMLTNKEGVIAVSHYQDGRMTFPETIIKRPEGVEFAAVAVVNQESKPQLIVGVTQGTGNSMKLEYQRFVQNDAGEWERSEKDAKLELTGAVGARGVRLVHMDANGDGRMDLLSVPSGTAKSGVQVLLQKEDGSFELVKQKSQLDLGVSAAGRTFVAGSRLLVARDSFARALTFGDSGWKVEDQFNAGETAASLEGVAMLDLDGEEGQEIVLVDTGVRKLRVMNQQEGVYRPWKEVDLGSIQFSSTLVADLNGDSREDLLLVGGQQFSVLYAGRSDFEMKEVAVFESDRDDAYPADIIAGDLNGDGQVDLTLIDTSIDGVAILKYDGEDGIREATNFRVFEEKRLVSADKDRGTEPREGMVVDLTGDGRADLVLLCHDRMLLYPQDSGEPVTAKK